MTAIHFHREQMERLKRAARSQLPGVQHAHVLDALAKAIDFNKWESLSLALDKAQPFTVPKSADYRIVSAGALVGRLLELGYGQATE